MSRITHGPTGLLNKENVWFTRDGHVKLARENRNRTEVLSVPAQLSAPTPTHGRANPPPHPLPPLDPSEMPLPPLDF